MSHIECGQVEEFGREEKLMPSDVNVRRADREGAQDSVERQKERIGTNDVREAFDEVVEKLRELQYSPFDDQSHKGDGIGFTVFPSPRSRYFAYLEAEEGQFFVSLHLEPDANELDSRTKKSGLKTEESDPKVGNQTFVVRGPKDLKRVLDLIKRADETPYPIMILSDSPADSSGGMKARVESRGEGLLPSAEETLAAASEAGSPSQGKELAGEPQWVGASSPVEAIAEAIKSMNPPHGTIGLFGEWGSGKSSVLKSLKAELDKGPESKEGKESRVFEFNAWQYDRPKEVMNYLFYDVFRQLHSSAPGVWRKLQLSLAYFGSRRTFMPFKSFGMLSVSAAWDNPVRVQKDPYDAFRDLLKASGLKRIVILLDDLDRCSSEGVGKLVEAMSILSGSKPESSRQTRDPRRTWVYFIALVVAGGLFFSGLFLLISRIVPLNDLAFEGAESSLLDTEWHSSPLGWALSLLGLIVATITALLARLTNRGHEVSDAGYVFVAAVEYGYLKRSVELFYKEHADAKNSKFEADRFLEKVIQVSYPIAHQKVSWETLEKIPLWKHLETTWLQALEIVEGKREDQGYWVDAVKDVIRNAMDRVLGHNIRRTKKTINTFQVLGRTHWKDIAWKSEPGLRPFLVFHVVALDIAEKAVLESFLDELKSYVQGLPENKKDVKELIARNTPLGSGQIANFFKKSVIAHERPDLLFKFFSDTTDGLGSFSLEHFLEVCRWRGYPTRTVDDYLKNIDQYVGNEEFAASVGKRATDRIDAPKDGSQLDELWAKLPQDTRTVLEDALRGLASGDRGNEKGAYMVVPRSTYYRVHKAGRTIATITPRVRGRQILAFRARSFPEMSTQELEREYPGLDITRQDVTGQNYGFIGPTLLLIEQPSVKDSKTKKDTMVASIKKLVRDAETSARDRQKVDPSHGG